MTATKRAKPTPRAPAANSTKQRPPVGRPWPKGVSGNPSGRPKGISLATVLSRLLTEEEAERIVKAVMREAAKGNMQAFGQLIDRTDGKVPNRIQHGGDPGNEAPIELTIIRAAADAQD